jgi:hypothetical protein
VANLPGFEPVLPGWDEWPGKSQDKAGNSEHPQDHHQDVPQLGLSPRLLLKFFQEPDIGKIHFSETPEIEQVDDHRDGYSQ